MQRTHYPTYDEMIDCGDTFYASDDEDVEPHLHVVVTPPHNGEVVTVSITTLHKKSETLVVLNVGDHPFIKWKSVMSYRNSRIRTVADIDTAVQDGLATKKEPVSSELLRRIRMGLRDSEFTPNGVRHFYLELRIDV